MPFRRVLQAAENTGGLSLLRYGLLERVGEFFGGEDGQFWCQSAETFGFGGMGVAEFEQARFPGDQIGGLGGDGQVEQVVVFRMLGEGKTGRDMGKVVGEFEGLLQNGGGVLGREAGQTGLQFGAEEKPAQLIEKLLTHGQAEPAGGQSGDGGVLA